MDTSLNEYLHEWLSLLKKEVWVRRAELSESSICISSLTDLPVSKESDAKTLKAFKQEVSAGVWPMLSLRNLNWIGIVPREKCYESHWSCRKAGFSFYQTVTFLKREKKGDVFKLALNWSIEGTSFEGAESWVWSIRRRKVSGRELRGWWPDGTKGKSHNQFFPFCRHICTEKE